MKNSQVRFPIVLLLCTFPGFVAQSGFAQNSNPTGNAGRFNALSTTGCSYDPYTMNATRTIPDLTVAGAVGAYPLQWSRTMNSRGIGSYDLGAGGGWTHSYYWYLAPSEIFSGLNGGTPSSYTVTFPNGSVETFDYNSSTGTCSPAFLGISDRFLPQNPTTLLAYLILPDGGEVEFQATKQTFVDNDDSTNPPTITYTSWYTYQAQAIIDPSGLRTSLTYDSSGKLTKVTEPAGRWLKIYYRTDTGYAGLVDHVDAGYGTSTVTQEVTYGYQVFTSSSYSYKTLTSTSYSDGTSASYTYQNSNVYPFDGRPLIKQCNDVRYPGPMKNIAYDFLFSSYNIYGQLHREKHPDGTPVITVTMTGNARTETRGDGAVRTFTFSANAGNVPKAYLLLNATDFLGGTTNYTYDANGYVGAIQDANLHTNSFTRLAATGALTRVDFASDANTPAAYVLYSYEDPTTGYHLKTVTDELGHVTTYKHSDTSTMNTTEIDYADGGIESFVYNGFNEVMTHTLLSGVVETYGYDGRGLLTSYTPPATPLNGDPNPSAHPTAYTYDINDHLLTVKDPRGYTTTFGHNERGQLTSVAHPDGSSDSYVYNSDMTLQYESLHLNGSERADTHFTYDDYKRVLTVTDPVGRLTKTWYDKNGNAISAYDHTESAVTRLLLPSQKVVVMAYDDEWRKASTTAGFGTTEAATTTWSYDAVGNLLTTTEPNGQPSQIYAGAKSVYTYDARNRRLSAKDPDLKLTSWTYDLAGNLKKETRPDLKFRSWVLYDGRNRIKQTTGFKSEQTLYSYDSSGNLISMTDSKGAVYLTDYDVLSRIRQRTYPVDVTGTQRTEKWNYDIAGNLAKYTAPNGTTKTFSYDNRERAILADWDTSNGKDVATEYDYAGRVTKVTSGSTVVAFGYDKSGFKLWEDQTLGSTTQRVSFTPDPDGNRGSLSLTGVYSLTYDYTQRQQLWHIYKSGSNWLQYSYDLSGNLTKRQDKGQGLDSTNFAYDQLNRATLTEQTGANDVSFARSHYTYDLLNNVKTTYREEQGNLGEIYGYDELNQLSSVSYNAAVTTPSPSPTPTVATPTFVPVAGAYPASDYPKTITISTTTTSANMRYTTNGTIPTSTVGTLIGASSGTASVPSGTTLKAIAFKSGSTDSGVASGTYSVASTVAAPIFVPVAGAYPASDYPKTVTISTTTTGANMRYTTNGAIPTSTVGTLIGASTGTASVPSGATLKAIAFKSGLTDSAVASGLYSVAAAVATPSFVPAAGGYKSSDYPKTVTISTTTTGANMRYTTDGSTPTAGSSGHGTLIAASSGTASVAGGATLKAIAYKGGLSDSAIQIGAFTVLPPCATPVLNPPNRTDGPVPPKAYTVNLSTTTTGAQISYTRDGSTPTPTHGAIVGTNVNVTIGANTYATISAMAFKSTNSDSGIVSGYFDNQNDGGNKPSQSPSPSAKAGPASSSSYELWLPENEHPVVGTASPGKAEPSPAQVSARLIAMPRSSSSSFPSPWDQAAAATGLISDLQLAWSRQQVQMDGSTSPRTVTYTVDAINRTSMNDGGTVTSYTPNALNQYSAVTGQSPAYDNNFNLTNFDGYIYTFDADNRPLSATGGGHTVTFVYDGLGRCVQRTVDGAVTNFTYDGWKPIAEWSSSNTLNAWNLYGAGADEIAMRYQTNATPSYLHYHSDQFGNVKYLLDSANAIVESYTYDAFGAPTITKNGIDYPESTCANRFMFTGREYLPEANVYDCRARAYSPELGRFLQADPIGFAGDPANLYRYCGNNPVNRSDPMGEIAEQQGNHWVYVIPGGRDYLTSLVGAHVQDKSSGRWLQCAGTMQVLGGGYQPDGQWHDVPLTRLSSTTPNWYKGDALTPNTRIGTVVASNWGPNGDYPNNPAGPNHTLSYAGPDGNGGYTLISAQKDQSITETTVSEGQLSNYNVVNVPLGNGPYDARGSTSVVIGDFTDAGAPIYEGRVVSPSFLSGLFNMLSNFFAGNPAIAAPGIQPAFAEPHMRPGSLDSIRQL